MEKQRILEISAAIILLAVLVLGSVVVVSAGSDSNTEITNSFNTYHINSVPVYDSHSSIGYSHIRGKPYIYEKEDYYHKYDNDHRTKGFYYFEDDYDYKERSEKRYLRYDDSGTFRKHTGIIGNKVDNYEVDVYNKDYKGGYFKVVFYFEDHYGNTETEAITHYIPGREDKKFVLKDVYGSRNDNKKVWYEVESLSKVKVKN